MSGLSPGGLWLKVAKRATSVAPLIALSLALNMTNYGTIVATQPQPVAAPDPAGTRTESEVGNAQTETSCCDIGFCCEIMDLCECLVEIIVPCIHWFRGDDDS